MKIRGTDNARDCFICREFKNLVIHLLSGEDHKYICSDCVAMMYGLLLMNKQLNQKITEQPIMYKFPYKHPGYGTGDFPPFDIPSTGDPPPEVNHPIFYT